MVSFFFCTIFFNSFFSISHSAAPPSDKVQQVDVAIVGAGLSGLATAYHLKKAGLSYRLLELTPRAGGRVRTVEYHLPGEPPYSVDSGMEEYWESNPAVSVLKELKLPLSHDVAVSSIVLNKTFYRLGDEDQEQFYGRVFSPEERAKLAAFKTEVTPIVEHLVSRQRQGKAIDAQHLTLKDQSFKDWVEAKGLPSKVSEWIRVSVECEVGTSWEKFSALDGLAEFHIFLGKGEESYRVTSGNESFIKGLVQAVGPSRVLLNQRVTRIETLKDPAGKVRVSYLDQITHAHNTLEAKAVVSTVPIFRAPLEIQFVPELSGLKRAAMMSQSWGSYFKAHVFFNKSAKRHWSDGNTSALPILSDSPLGVIYDGNKESSGTKIISLLTFGSHAERFNMMPLDAVRTELTKAFESFWPGSAAEIKGMEFYRFHPRAIAGWPVGRSRFDSLSEEMRKPENRVYFAGDFTETTHSDGAFISAERVTRQILEEVRKNGNTPSRALGMVPPSSDRPVSLRDRPRAGQKVHR